jgi:hypothetical protein
MTYQDLNYNEYLERPLTNDAPEGEVSSDAVQALMESGAITGDMLAKAIIGNDNIKNEIIKNIKLQDVSRSFKAIVTTDNTGTHGNINEAVKYVHDKGGGVVYIKSGRYKINYNIQLYSKVKLIGDGPGETILDYGGTTNYIYLLGGLTELSLLMALDESALQNVIIQDLTIKNNDNQTGAVQIQYVRGLKIYNVLFTNNAYHLWIGNCIPALVENCLIGTGSANKGIIVSGGGHVIIRGCDFGYGADLSPSIEVSAGGNASNVIIEDCSFINSYDGILLSGGNNYIIKNNVFSGSLDYVIRVRRGGGGAAYYYLIDGNIFYLNGTANAISLYDATSICSYNGTISNNIIYNPDVGIYISQAKRTRVIGNFVDGGNTGLQITATGDRTVYDGNDFYNNGTAISNLGTNSTAGDNRTT